MSSIVIQGDTSGSITVEAPSVAGTHTLTLPKATGNIATDATVGLGMKNLIINGDMRIDQRNAGASVTPLVNPTYTIDRWFAAPATASKFSVQQSTTAPTNFSKSLLMTSLAATTVGASDYYEMYQAIEGYNMAHLNWGTANAKTVTLSFWVRSSLTGTFGGTMLGFSGGDTYPFTYTISSADTWEQKSITIPGPTSGTFGTTNNVGCYVGFNLGAGTSVSATAGSWQNTLIRAPSGSVQVVATSGATLYITGVQLEVGENATPFENRMYGTELALCQRYYTKSKNQSVAESSTGASTGALFTLAVATNSHFVLRFPVTMRAAPTVTIQSTYNNASGQAQEGGSSTNKAVTTANIGETGVGYIALAGTATSGQSYYAHYIASAEL